MLFGVKVQVLLTISLQEPGFEFCHGLINLELVKEPFNRYNSIECCRNKILKCDIEMKSFEQYFPVVLFIMLYKVVLTFESVDEILKCDNLNESY